MHNRIVAHLNYLWWLACVFCLQDENKYNDINNEGENYGERKGKSDRKVGRSGRW